jgi:phosphoserine phosphatase
MTSRFGLAIFDVDSTLVALEGIDFLARGDARIVELTEKAMNGEIPLDEVYGRRLELIRPTEDDVAALAAEYRRTLLPDAKEVIAALRDRGIDVHLVTAGIEQAILPLAAELGLQPRVVHAVRLLFHDDGSYRDFDHRSPLTRKGGKEVVVTNIRVRAKGKVVMIGDGVSDLEARPVVDLFVGFGGVAVRERVKKESDYFIEEPRLTPLLQYLEER